MQPLVSIITVTYNAAAILEETIQSVLRQTFSNYEYLIIDGASSDHTLEVISRYQDKIKLISEPDKGIYDAMNKGIAMAKGTWIYFLNAGDLFYDEQVLETLFHNPVDSGIRLLYGKVRTKNHPSGTDITLGKPVQLNSFYYRVGICHQAAFTHAEAFKTIGHYRASEYRILADQEWFVRFFKSQGNAQYVNRTIAWYEVVGQSSRERELNHQEHLKMVSEHFNTRVKMINAARNPFMRLKIGLLRRVNNTVFYKWYRKLFFSN